jgi:superfamily II DNA or RNA helicase
MGIRLLDPIELFAELDKSKIRSLRKAQEQILSHYFANLQKEKRIGIKLPTGSGKSLIAILILENWRRSGKVAAIVTANKGLADDMRERCEEVGVPCATIFSARAWRDKGFKEDSARIYELRGT